MQIAITHSQLRGSSPYDCMNPDRMTSWCTGEDGPEPGKPRSLTVSVTQAKHRCQRDTRLEGTEWIMLVQASSDWTYLMHCPRLGETEGILEHLYL